MAGSSPASRQTLRLGRGADHHQRSSTRRPMSFRTEVSGPPVEPGSDRPFLERIHDWVEKDPDRFAYAVDHPDHVENYTYQDVWQRSGQIAASLTASGLVAGARVGILMDNSPGWVFALLGTLRLGGVCVPLSPLLPAASIRRLVEHSDCKWVFADEGNRETAVAACESQDVEVIVVDKDAPSCTGWDEFLARGNDSVAEPGVSPDGTAVLMYTSGTTGDPKGVRISAKGLAADINGLIELLELSPDHRMLSVLPFSHVLPLVANALGSLGSGAGVVFLPAISPQRIVAAFKQHRISFFVCVPQFFYAVHKRIFARVAEQSWVQRKLFGLMFGIAKRTNNPAFRRKLFSRIHAGIGPDLTLLVTGGSRFEPQIAEDFETLGYTMVQAYGLTETSAAATATPVAANAIGTVGLPLRGVSIRIDNPNDVGIGEVCVRGDILMQGYYRNEEATTQAIRDGWLHTGDLGQLDSDGNLVITGRSKDVIVLSTGKNIYPEEVEEHYEKCPYVKEMCVMGLPDASSPGDTLHAIVVPDMEEFRRRNQTGIGDLIRYEFDNRSRELASFMRIHSLAVRNDPLPRTVTRKLKRFQIYEEEVSRTKAKEAPEATQDHERLTEGAGLVVARAIHDAKAALGALSPAMNFELDLGFDSLGRVELLTDIESELGLEVNEEAVNQIFTIDDLLEAIEEAGRGAAAGGRSWKEKLTADGDDELAHEYIRESRTSLTYFGFPTIRIFGAIAKIPFRTKVRGLDKLPKEPPFLICPNHVSYLDPFLVCSILPLRVIRDIFILGYTDYFESPMMAWLGSTVNIVPVDPNANLTRAMRIAAVGLRRKRILLVFPEGERSFHGNLTPFKKGAAILSTELNVPLVPIGIRGTFEAWPRGGSLRAHPVEIVIGDPIYPEAFRDSGDPHSAINEALRNAVAGLVDRGP